MASRLLCSKSRVVGYLPNLHAVVKHFRNFSSYDEQKFVEFQVSYTSQPSEMQTVWPDSSLGPLGPQDKRFVMPGLVGPTIKNHEKIDQCIQLQSPVDTDKALVEMEGTSKNFAMVQYLTELQMHQRWGSRELALDDISPSDRLECAAQECPVIIRKDFSDLFPGRNIMDGNFTVITISQQTDNDMTSWTEEVEIERNQLLDSFVQGAREICEALQEAGYWADFIDPASGKPFLGPHTNSTMFETDERYRKLGFKIKDLGCCKVITHHMWGTNAYVGCLFTDAPLDHPVLQRMRK